MFSSTLAQVHTQRTRLERQLDAQVVAEIKAKSRGDVTIGGLTLAAEALRLDLVDVVELLWYPVLLGGGIPILSAGVRRYLRLRSQRCFSNGVGQDTGEQTDCDAERAAMVSLKPTWTFPRQRRLCKASRFCRASAAGRGAAVGRCGSSDRRAGPPFRRGPPPGWTLLPARWRGPSRPRCGQRDSGAA